MNKMLLEQLSFFNQRLEARRQEAEELANKLSAFPEHGNPEEKLKLESELSLQIDLYNGLAGAFNMQKTKLVSVPNLENFRSSAKIDVAIMGGGYGDLTNDIYIGKSYEDLISYVNKHRYKVNNESAFQNFILDGFWYK